VLRFPTRLVGAILAASTLAAGASAAPAPAGPEPGSLDTAPSFELSEGPGTAAAPDVAAGPGASVAPDAPLELAEVLVSAGRHYPGILEALAQRRGVEAELVKAQGAFDLVFGMDSVSRLSGFYDGRVTEAQARQPLRPLGASLYGSYALSRGDFPIYEDEYFTNRGGRLKFGAVFSLLRDRTVDPRRFEVADARLALREAELDVLMTRIGVQRRAVGAYWQWVATGHQLAVYEALLRIAEDREEGLTEQVERGARARIQLTENRQNITRRRSLVVAADADFRKAANQLALYFRDGAGEPVIPGRARLPGQPPSVPAVLQPEALAPEQLPRLVELRPELTQLRTAIERARQRIALEQNALKPRLDLAVEVGQPFGAVGEGGPSRDTTDTIVGLTFSVPLQRREAEGALQAAEAELEALRQERRLLVEQLELEMLDLLLELEVAQQLAQLAAREVAQAETLMQAERRRFQEGASDFFLVNVREEAVADARIRFLQADLRQRLARADYDAATLNLERLGIAPPGGTGSMRSGGSAP
jgi:outer membrane protein TolC